MKGSGASPTSPSGRGVGADVDVTTEGPSWGQFKRGLGAVSAVLEPFCGNFLQKLTKPSKIDF